MLDYNQIAAASQILHDHWRAGTKLGGLETSLRPRDRAEAYAIQAAIEIQSGGKLFGWKIAATSEAGQKHINVDGPMAGRILPETVIADGGTASMAGNEMRVAEPEFAFRMRTDLPPRHSPYTVQEVLDAVDTLHPAIEIPDSRFSDFVGAGAEQIIADNACAHLFVLGAPRGLLGDPTTFLAKAAFRTVFLGCGFGAVCAAAFWLAGVAGGVRNREPIR